MICENVLKMVPCDILLKTTRGSNPLEDIASHTITGHPSCFTVGTRQSTRNASVGVRQPNTCPVVWNNVNEDSSVQMTCFHCICIHTSWSSHHCNLFISFRTKTNGFGIATLLWMFAACNSRWIVLMDTGFWKWVLISDVICVSTVLRFQATILFNTRLSRSFNFDF